MSLRPGYRLRQFWLALAGNARTVEEEVLRRHLNTEQVLLFRRMSAAEQAHALAVLHTVQKQKDACQAPSPGAIADRESGACPCGVGSWSGEVEPALVQAALLHDVGKTAARIRLWHRVATVLLQALVPELLHRLALNAPHSWRYPFFVQLHHAELGADLAAGAGTDSAAVVLIRVHHISPEQSGLDTQGRALLLALQSADEVN